MLRQSERRFDSAELRNTIEENYLCLSILKTVDNLGQIPNVPPTERHKLTGDYDGCWAISISKNWRLLLRPLIGTEPNEITELEIFEIGDYH